MGFVLATRWAGWAVVCACLPTLLSCSTKSSSSESGNERQEKAPEAAAHRAALNNSGLVAAYSFDEGTGTTLNDVTGNGHDGVLSGQTWVPGRFGTALKFDDNLISIPASALLDLTTGMTLSAWINLDSQPTDWPTIVMKGGPEGLSYGLWAGWVGAAPSVLITNGPLQHLAGGEQAPPGYWTHLAATYDGDTLRLYVDGNLEASLQLGDPITTNALPLTIGGNSWGEYFPGAIDELRIYNRALTQIEIQQDMGTAVDGGQPRVLYFVSPPSGAVSGTLRTKVDVLDENTASVRYLVDGIPLGSPQTTGPFTFVWDSTTAGNGSHTLRVEALDSEENVLGADEVTVNVNNALVAAYSFDEGSGTILHDVTGNGHDAELSGQTWVQGKYGSALHFENSFITVADSNLLDLTTGMTLSAWVKQESVSGDWPTIVMKERPGDLCYGLWGDWTAHGPGVFVSDNGIRQELTASPQGIVGVWTHLAGTYDGETLRLYVDGTLEASMPVAITMAASSLPLTIGGNNVWGEFFEGAIDDLRIYNYALSQSAIQGVMSSPVGCNADDGNPCTTDTCDPVTGQPVNTPVPEGTSCADADVCNGEETCSANGECLPGTPLEVVPAGPCVAAYCDPVLGLVQEPRPAGFPCNDGNVCNGAELCDGNGVCEPGVPPSLEDGDPCTVGSCDPGLGVQQNPAPNGTPCDDGNACSQTDTCQEGICVGTNPVICTALSQCHDAGTCDPLSGTCSNPAKTDGTACDDGDLCTVGDSCASGTCVSGTEVVVEEIPCKVGYCDAGTGGVIYDDATDGIPCNDGNACTQTDTCQAGVCVGSDPVVCPDGPCVTASICDPQSGACSGSALPDGTSCDDGDPCTVGDTCSSGSCQPGESVVIEDRPCNVGYCDASGTVVYEPVSEGTSCALDACTQGTCNASGECIPSGAAPVVDDGDPCTIERCDPVLGPITVHCGEVDRTVATTVLGATEWLFSGTNPIQTGVAPGTIEERRAALLRGKVSAADGSPLPNVRVTVHGHEELGQTTTHADGTFDMVVNGGGALQVYFHKDGHLDSSRRMDVRWNHTHTVPDVVLIQADPIVTEIDLDPNGTDYQVAVGSLITDDDGTRQATLLFPPGVQALMRKADGTHELLEQMHVRLTEFTVGSTGPAAMPADLPPNTGYTYAFEVNADEAVAIGAPEIEFSEPLVFYTDNFLGFPAGTVVPVGSFDRERGFWVPHENGFVMTVLGVDDGLALIDVTGNGQADSESTLANHGITEEERAQLALLYPDGASLWRVRIPHFTEPYDLNWPFGFPADAELPDAGPPMSGGDEVAGSCSDTGSILDCQNQTLRESIGITGTPFTLNYSSARVPGRLDAFTTLIPLIKNAPPASLKRIDIKVEVAGRAFEDSVIPAPQQQVAFTWDGLDAYGRTLQGRQRAIVRLRYVYDGVYQAARSFGVPGATVVLTGSRTRQELYMERKWETALGAWDAAHGGLGGWSLNVHHAYDAGTGQLLLGDGTSRSATVLTPVVRNLAGEFPVGLNEGGPARRATVTSPTSVAVGSDGSVYFCDSTNSSRLRRINPDGMISTVAGTGVAGYSGDNGPAIQAQIRCNTSGMGIGPDGSIYLAHDSRVRRVGPDGIITTVAGTGVPGYSGDGGPATEAQINYQNVGITIAVGPEGNLFITDRAANRVRQVTPDGTIFTIAGTGTALAPPPADGSNALQASFKPLGIAVDGNGLLYILVANPYTSHLSDLVYTLGTDGRLRHLAGCRESSDCSGLLHFNVPARQARWYGGGALATLAVSADGEVNIFGHLASFSGQSGPRRVLTVDPDGILRTRLGEASGQSYRTGAAAPHVNLDNPYTGAFGPNGLVVVESTRVTSIEPAMAGITTLAEFTVPSEDGQELYVFGPNGRHLRTLHALTLQPLYEFEYDANGLLSTIEDAAGKVTVIEREPNGHATGIVSP